MNYIAATYSNINPVVFYGGGFCGGVDPRREQYAGEDVAGVAVPNYKTKYEALQKVIKDNYQLFEVDYYGIDNDNYVDGAGFCCEPKAQAKNARSLPTENVDYEKLQYYYHSDHLGSASYITNLDGEVVQHIEYVPFGEVFLEERNNTWNTPFLFNGKELDEETGLYYYGARYYNPRISLWYGVDPLFEKYPAHSPYCYTMNNPVMLIDPDGMRIDKSSLSKPEKKEYNANIRELKKNKLFKEYHRHLRKSDDTYYIKPGSGAGGSGSFNPQTKEIHSVNNKETLAQEMFHAYQSDLGVYTSSDMSVRETEGDLVSSSIAASLANTESSKNYVDKQTGASVGVGTLSVSNPWDQGIGLKYTDQDFNFTDAVLSKNFDQDFNNAVNARIQFYKNRAKSTGDKAPPSYIQNNSGAGAKALKVLMKNILK